jgi:hypothetical protein
MTKRIWIAWIKGATLPSIHREKAFQQTHADAVTERLQRLGRHQTSLPEQVTGRAVHQLMQRQIELIALLERIA